MHLPTPLSLVLSALLLSTATTAAPTRTNCRCIVVVESPSAAHWTPSDPTPIATPSASLDKCASLGPELQSLKYASPASFASHIARASSKTTPQMPLSTADLLRAEGGNAARPFDKVVCFTEPASHPTYSDTCTLWVLQIIVAVTILACIAEACHLAVNWFTPSPAAEDESSSEKHASPLRLPGAERLLCAFPTADAEADCVFSPGADKKSRAYEEARFFVVKAKCGRREFIAYDSEDDDESNRPVM